MFELTTASQEGNFHGFQYVHFWAKAWKIKADRSQKGMFLHELLEYL